MDLLITGLVILAPVLLANVLVLRDRDAEKQIFHWLLLFLNIPVLLIGVGLSFLPPEVEEQLSAQLGVDILDYTAIGIILILLGLWGMLVSLSPVRKLLSRIMPIQVDSPVHTLALVFSGYLVGQGALALSQGGLEGLSESAEPTSLSFLIVSELLFAALGLLGVGFLIRRRGSQVVNRLALQRPTAVHLLIAFALIAVLVVFQAIMGVIWAFLNPEQAELLTDLNELLLADFDTVWEWLLLALAAGIGEEILFRGALQPVLGLGFTSLLFALVHVQYGFSTITIFFIVMAVVLGLVKRYTNTTTAIIIHVGYDFVLGLFALLANYLQEFVG